MRDSKKIKSFFLFLAVIFLCFATYACNESSSKSGNDDINSTTNKTTWYKDADNDGYGDPSSSLTQQSQPEGYIKNAEDCNDYDGDVYPGAAEICDGKDNDCDNQTDENACDTQDIRITGNIINLVEAQDFIAQDSYIQLVALPDTGEIESTTDGRGRLCYTSDLAELEIPDDGSFVFETTGLVPGQYVIAAQLLKSYDLQSGTMPILSDTESQLIQIEVPEEYESPLDIELGDVIIPVPEEQTQNTDSSPPPPTGVSASDGDYSDKIRVTWNASSGATAYEIYRADSFSGNKSKLTSTAGLVYDDTSTLCNIDYYYWVKAKSPSGTSEFFYNDLGYRQCPAPPAPANVAASDGTFTNKVRIAWQASAGATSYDIFRASTPGGPQIKIASTADLQYEDTTAACPNTYYYSVKAKNFDGTSNFSNSDSGKKDCSGSDSGNDNPPPIADVPVPTGVSASDGTFLDKIRITWVATSGATSYDVYRSVAECDEKIKIGSSSTNLYDDLSINSSDKKTYYYWVKAITAQGTSEFSRFDTGYIMRIPPVPTGVSASDGAYLGMIRVIWNPTPTATSYEIYRCFKYACSSMTKIGTTTVNSFDDTDVSCYSYFTEYYTYSVRALNPAGVSGYSEDDDGYVYQTAPNPHNISASDGTIACCVKITWDSTCDDCSPIKAASYNIYRASSPEGTKTKIGSVLGGCCPTYSFRDSTATCPNVYYYWVRSVDANGVECCIFNDYDSGFCSGCQSN